MARVTRSQASQSEASTTKQTKASEAEPKKTAARGKAAAAAAAAAKKDEPVPAKQQRKRKADDPATETNAPAKKSKTSIEAGKAAEAAKKGRGKKAAEAPPVEEALKAETKKGGRGRKAAVPASEAVEESPKETVKKGGRGRKATGPEPEPEAVEEPAPAKKGRGKKTVEPTPEPEKEESARAPKRGGRGKKANEPAPAPVEEDKPTPAKKGGRGKKAVELQALAAEDSTPAPKKGRGKKAGTAAPVAPSKVTKKAAPKAKASSRSAAKKDAAEGKEESATLITAEANEEGNVTAEADAGDVTDTDMDTQPEPEAATDKDTEMADAPQPEEQPEDKENEQPEEPSRNRFVTPEEQKTPRSRRVVRDLVITPAKERTINEIPPILPPEPEDAGEGASKAPPPPPKKAKPQRTDMPGSSKFTALNSGAAGTPKNKTTPKSTSVKNTPKSAKKTPIKRKSIVPNEFRSLHPDQIPGLFFKTLSVPQPDWEDKIKPNWAKMYDSGARLAVAQRSKKLGRIEHDAYITEKGYNRLKKLYADIDKRLPEKMEGGMWMIRDRDGYAVIEVIENNLRDYFNELTKPHDTSDPHGHDIIYLYSIAEAVILFLQSQEDYHYTQVDDGDRVEALVNLIACMTLDLIWRLHIYKDLFTTKTPLKSLPLIMGVAVDQLSDLATAFGFELDGGQRVDEDASPEVQKAMDSFDAIGMIRGVCRKAKIPLYAIKEKGLEVLENTPGEGEGGFLDIDWINVDFEQQVWAYLGKSPAAMVYCRNIEDAGFGGREYLPGRSVWVLCGPGEDPNDFI